MANTRAEFVHPSEMGLDFPINTQAELAQIGKVINKTINNSSTQYRQNYDKIFRIAQAEVTNNK